MATTSSTAGSHDAYEHEITFSRGARLGLLGLLLFTVAFASGILFVKHQLEAFRADVQEELEARYGARLRMGAIAVNGLRGLRIDDLRVTVPLDNGPNVTVDADAAFINIKTNDLLYGRINVEGIVLEGHELVLERPRGSAWVTEGTLAFEDYVPFEIEGGDAFRVTGADGAFEIRNIVGETRLRIVDFDFDISRLVDAADVNAVLQGHLDGAPEKRVRVRLAMNSLEDFDLQVKTDLITAEDVNVVLPADQHLVLQGAVHPTLWINGRPNKTLVVSLDAPFEDLLVRDHPEFLEPASGLLTLVATYSTDDKKLSISTATADTNQLNGNLEGSIAFAGDYPSFDLNLNARRIPIADVVDNIWPGEVTEFGRLDLALDEPHELQVRLAGTSQEPQITASTRSATGALVFTPADEAIPEVRLSLNQIEGTWDSGADDLRLGFDIVDGKADHPDWGVAIESVRGRVTVQDNVLRVSPLNARCNGESIFGEAEFDLAKDTGRVDFDGTLANIESTALGRLSKDLKLAGAIEVNGSVTVDGDAIDVDGEIDATQSTIDFRWWARKPNGMGTTAKVHAYLDGTDTAFIELTGDVASSELWARMKLAKRDVGRGLRWHVMDATATTEAADINSAARIARIPYRVTGGTASSVFFEFTRDPSDFNVIRHSVGGFVDEISLLALSEDTNAPVVVRDAVFDLSMMSYTDSRTGETGVATLHAREFTTGPFGETWLIPIKPPPDWKEEERDWDLTIVADHAELPPWKGENLRATAYADARRFGLDRYEARVGVGRIEGSYVSDREDRTYSTEATWSDVSVDYFLQHLQFPDAITGPSSGTLRYSIDRDDPSTLRGEGRFEVTGGRFSADFLHDLIQGSMDTGIATIPADLDFVSLSSDISFDRDVVTTPNLKLEGKSIQIDGSGRYVHDGDMDYTLKVAVDPEAAQRIPMLMENFNVRGHQLSGNDIALTFRLAGPTFNPQGRVEELPPARVTLMSGAMEVTREAVGIIDLPRKLLVDLLKIGGGIVAGGNANKPAPPRQDQQ